MKHFLIFLVFIFSFFCTTVKSQVLQSDSLALVALYNQTGGSTWTTKTNWLTGPVGNWFGIIRTGNRVTTINLPNNNLSGSLPSVLGNLTAVTQLSLGNNNLSGSIPSEIGSMTSLKFLYLWGNQLTGSIPTTLGSLTSLEFLWLYANQLTGSIPTTIGSITTLKSLIIRNNQLSGPIPATLGNLINLEFLNLSSNKLSDQLPDQIGNLVKIKELILDVNELTGPLPSSITNLNKLNKLIVKRNKFNGEIPSNIGNLIALTHIDFQNNNLTGSIPASIWSLTNLVELLLGNESGFAEKNAFTGSISTTIGGLQSLVTFKVQDNKLSGPVPSEISLLFNLNTLDLSNNDFTSLPDLSGLPVLSSCDVRNNLITFKHIYGNRLLPNFLYAPQKTTALTTTNPNQPTTEQVGSSFLIELNDNTQGNVYQWFFNGQPIPANTGSLLIKRLDYNSMGVYSCVVTNTNLPGLTYTFQLKVDAVTNISGTLFTNTNQPAVSGEVSLYKITDSGPYIPIPPTQVRQDGTYTFEEVVLGDYVIRGFADTTAYPGSVPTWYTKVLLWEEADSIQLRNMRGEIDITSLIKDNQAGEGIITGNFAEPIDEGGRIDAKNKVNYGVCARRIQRAGRGNEDVFDRIYYTFTNEEGDFTFENLEVGEYRLNIQFPGYPMDETSFIDIPIGDDLFTRQVGVQAEVINQKIVIKKLIITALDKEESGWEIFPNPTNDFLFIKGINNSETKIEFHNSAGLKQSINHYWNDSLNEWTINLENFAPGVYFLTLRGNDIKRFRIIIN